MKTEKGPMTPEEAIKIILEDKELFIPSTEDDLREAIDMAVEALRAQANAKKGAEYEGKEID